MTNFTRKSAPATTLIRKRAATEIKAVDAAQGIVTAYVNTLGMVDHDNDVIEPGAFMRSLARGKKPVVCWMHNWSDVIGQVTEAKEETVTGADGRPLTRLLATMQFDMDDPQAVRYFGKVRKGYTDEWSVGFYALAETYAREGDTMTRHINDLDWCEVSPVLRGASPGTTTVSAKTVETPPAPVTEEANPSVQVNSSNATLEPDTAHSSATAPGTLPDAPGTDSAEALLELYRVQAEQAGIPVTRLKAGRRNSAADAKDIQAMHDIACRLGAACGDTEE